MEAFNSEITETSPLRAGFQTRQASFSCGAVLFRISVVDWSTTA